MKNATPIDRGYLRSIPAGDEEKAERMLCSALEKCHSKVIVLDDDPTGTQTVHDVPVYTDWNKETMLCAFEEPDRVAYFLTNSRAMTQAQTEEVHRQIATSIAFAAGKSKKNYILISRSDSTLRGHFPLETETLREALCALGEPDFDGEIIYPFFLEGGRYTINGVHYVLEEDRLIPAGQTEFAKDKSFGYTASFLPEWCAEKSKGKWAADSVFTIPLEELRTQAYETITERLMRVSDFAKVVVDSVDYTDVKVFIAAYLQAVARGKRFMFRSAAAVPKVLGGISDQALLGKEEIFDPTNHNGGLIVVGSHVQKTSRQLRALQMSDLPIRFIQFDQHRVLETNGLKDEARRVGEEVEDDLLAGYTTVVYTRRDRLDLDTDDAERQLEVSVQISEAITSIVANLKVRPRFIIAKGGITSSSIATDALRVRRAIVMGQVFPGIPVWETGEESKFPRMPYVIFPGNVGGEETLLDIVRGLV